MDENSQANQNQNTAQSSSQTWDDVGRQFQSLGESLAQAFRTEWHKEENKQRIQEMKTGLKSMVEEVGKAIEEGANSEKGQKVIAEAERAAESLRKAGKETVKEVQPHLVTALKSLNTELQKLIERMEKEDRV